MHSNVGNMIQVAYSRNFRMPALDTLYIDIDRFQEPCLITYKYRFMELDIEFTEMEALKGFDIKGHEKASGINTNKMFNMYLFMYKFVPRVSHLM